MSDLSDARLNPRTNAVAWRVMDPETHTIAEFDFCPGQYGFQLQDSVQQTTLTLTENVTGGTEFELVLTAPNVGQCYVNYANGICVFNVADLGKEVNSNAYNGGGSNANIVNLGLLASFSGKTTDDLDEGVTNLYANATSIPAIINAAAAKTTPVDADIVGIGDSAASFGLKKLTFANLFLWIVTKIFGLTGKTTPVDADQLLITDSAASNVGKSLTWANLKATLKTYFDTLYPTYTTPTSVTPVFTGFGTVSALTAYTWRVGAVLMGQITVTLGTTTATEARIGLRHNPGSGEVDVTTASNYPTLQIVGDSVNNTNTGNYPILAEASKTYITLGVQVPGSSAGLIKKNGTELTTGSILSIKFMVRINGWT
jgi:hypothetical protein